MSKKTQREVYPIVPGTILKMVLNDRGISQKQFCKDNKRPEKWLSEVIRCKASLTIEAALLFENSLGIEAEFWLNLQMRYDLCEARGKQNLYHHSMKHDQ